MLVLQPLAAQLGATRLVRWLAVVFTLALLAASAFMALQAAPHVLSALLSLVHLATSGAHPMACGVIPGSCPTLPA